jgi:hypothetical protein
MPTLVTLGGPTRAAGVPGVSDKVQLGAGFPCGGSPGALPLISGCCLGCPARRTGSAPQGRSPVRAWPGAAERSGAALIKYGSIRQHSTTSGNEWQRCSCAGRTMLSIWMQTRGACQVGTTTTARGRCLRSCMRAIVRPRCCTGCCTELMLKVRAPYFVRRGLHVTGQVL